MKKILIISMAVATLALLGLIPYSYCQRPVLTVVNTSGALVSDIRVETDAGESYSLPAIQVNGRERVRLSGRDADLWLTVSMPSVATCKSAPIYTTSGFDLIATIDASTIRVKWVR